MLKGSFHRSCNYTSTFKYWTMRTLCCYTSTIIMSMIYLPCQKLDTNWYPVVKLGCFRWREMDKFNSFLLHYLSATTLPLCSIIFSRDTKSLPQPRTSSSLEKQKASVEISPVSFLMIFHFKIHLFLKLL